MNPRVLRVALACALAGCASTASAQGVAVNATGAAADTSAILDLTSSSKGFLPPRMTLFQRGQIFSPATGLLVWQTDGAPGLYANTGTPGVPNWQLVGANATSGQWSVSGANLYYGAGKVGIGSAPGGTYGLEVVQTLNGMRVQTNTAGGQLASFGGTGTFDIDAPGVIGGRLRVAENGNVGLGVTNPTNKLSFPAVLGKKISLYPGLTGDVGFGVAGNRLQIYADNPNADVALGWDAAGTFNERFAVKPNGALAVVGNTGTAGQVLQSNGSGAAATWSSPTQAAYNNLYQVVSSNSVTVTNTQFNVPIPDMSQTFNVATNAKVVVSMDLELQAISCFACGGSSAFVQLILDGGAQMTWLQSLGNGETHILSATHLLSVGPGSHTVSLQYYTGTGPDMRFGCTSCITHNVLTLQVVPQ
jgi:hypothetical protein